MLTDEQFDDMAPWGFDESRYSRLLTLLADLEQYISDCNNVNAKPMQNLVVAYATRIIHTANRCRTVIGKDPQQSKKIRIELIDAVGAAINSSHNIDAVWFSNKVKELLPLLQQ